MANQALIERHRIRVTGPRDATRSIVFIHGFGLTGESWQAVLPRFETEFRVVCYDHAGAGAPPKAQLPQQHYLNLDRYVADLLEVCDGLTLERPALVGHSVGGMIAALATLARPGRFDRLVLVGASPCYRNHDAYVGGFDDEALNRTYQAVLHQHEPWVREFSAFVANAPDRPEVARQFADALGRIPAEHALTMLCAILQQDHREQLARITTPTLILQSREDPFVPEPVAALMHARIPGSEYRIIESRGHFPQLYAPEVLAEAVHRFLA